MKVKGLFDHLKDLHTKNTSWDNLTESDRKSFSVYMVNRFLSMNPDYTDFINSLQVTTHNVSPEFVYKLYLEILPKNSGFFTKYIKSKTSKIYDQSLIKLLAKYLSVGEYEIIEWLDIHENLDFLVSVLEKFGLSDKDIAKMTKIKGNEE